MRVLDIGAFNGDSALKLIEIASNADEIIAFDPNNTFRGIWDAVEDRYPHITFYEGAVSNKNGKIKFTQRPNDKPFGSTTSTDKRDWGKGDVREVDCYDVADFIVPNTILKIDCEGGEYDILERIIDASLLGRVPRVYVEWHTNKMNDLDVYKQRQDKIEKSLADAGVEVMPW